MKNAELSFLTRTLRNDNEQLKKEKVLLVSGTWGVSCLLTVLLRFSCSQQEKLESVTKQLEPLKQKDAENLKKMFELRVSLDAYKKQLQRKTEEQVCIPVLTVHGYTCKSKDIALVFEFSLWQSELSFSH